MIDVDPETFALVQQALARMLEKDPMMDTLTAAEFVRRATRLLCSTVMGPGVVRAARQSPGAAREGRRTTRKPRAA